VLPECRAKKANQVLKGNREKRVKEGIKARKDRREHKEKTAPQVLPDRKAQ